MIRKLAYIAFALLLLVPSGSCQETEPNADDQETNIAVIPKGTTQVFWTSVESGARQAADELSVNVIWKGPLKENDRAQQISLVEQFVSEGVDGIVLAPLDEMALVRPVSIARSKGIPVVIIDSALHGQAGEDFVSFVATDNRKGGVMAGHHLAKLMNEKGKLVLLRYMVGSASTTNREEGFLSAIRKYPGIEVLVENQYGGATTGESIQKTEELLDQLRQADGVFCPNEATTYGMLVGLRKNKLIGSVSFVGFDASEELLRALQAGEIQALVVQNPHEMGHQGVKTVMESIEGKSVPPRIDTGVALVTPDNLQETDTQELVNPE